MRTAPGRADDLAVHCLAARERDAHGGGPGEEPGAGETPVIVIDGGLLVIGRRHRDRGLRHRICLARERRLVDLQPGAGDNDPVGRKRLAGPNEDQVTGHDLDGRDGVRRAVADHPRTRGEPGREPLGGRTGAAVEKDIHADEGDNRREQRQRLDALADHHVERTGPGKEPDHRILCRVANQIHPTAGRRLDDVVVAVATALLLDLRRGQPASGQPVLRQARRGQRAAHHVRWASRERASLGR